MIISVKAINYKMHHNIDVKLNGESFFLVGDWETGKSTFLEMIESSLGLIPFADDPLTKGAPSGVLEVVHDFGDGNLYTVRRRFNPNGLMRFEVTDQNGGSHTLTPLLQKIFGKAFTNASFDYKKYFYECKSKEARYEYFVKTLGGEPVLVNKKTIKEKTSKRAALNNEKATYLTLLNESIVDPDIIDEQQVKYNEPKLIEDAFSDPEVVKIVNQVNELNKAIQDYELAKECNEKVTVLVSRNETIDIELKALQDLIKDLNTEKKRNEKAIKANPGDFDYERELALEAEAATIEIAELEAGFDHVLNIAKVGIAQFNQEQADFKNGLKYFERFTKANNEWNLLDQEISDLEAENDKLFKEQLGIPEISISADDEIMYKGVDGVARELCFPNVSKGRSIAITAQIQRALNPGGKNFIIIPEGQSLGSGLDEVIEECKKFNMQYIVEVTERKQNFQIKFEEQYLNKPVKKARKI